MIKVYDGDASYLKHKSITVKVPKGAEKTETLISIILQSLNISQSPGNYFHN